MQADIVSNANTQAPTTSRVHMLDVVRGWSMFFIAGGDALLLAVCLAFPNLPGAAWMRFHLGHMQWEGFTFYDALFPTFLLISGASFTYSWQRQCAQGLSFTYRWGRLLLRTLLFIVLGVLYNGALSASSFAEIRYASVLGRIGLGVLLAAIAYVNLPERWRWVFFPVGLLAYAGLFELCGGDAPYAMNHNWAASIDRHFLPGRIDASGIDGLDPEGLVSTLGALFTAYLGMLLADFLRKKVPLKALWIALTGAGLLAFGFGGAPWVPIVKKLWTSTYVCVAGGWTLLFCAGIYLLTDVFHLKRCFAPITFFGTAALWFYLLPKLFDFRSAAWKLLSGVTTAWTTNQAIHALVCSLGSIILLWITVCLLRKGVQKS
ncbi:MAG: hypothetical protein IKW38_02710 [Kiritimatiellae bacterium]|nr:hypothetical protein [Kiritimatiellia bacterium]